MALRMGRSRGGRGPSRPAAQGARRLPERAGRPVGRGPGGRGSDFQQLLAHAPSVTLKDLQKGNMVIVVATEGQTPGDATAITIVAGVEPMLQASTSGSQAMLSSSWNLGGGGVRAVVAAKDRSRTATRPNCQNIRLRYQHDVHYRRHRHALPSSPDNQSTLPH